jgi:hypothetical protein
MTQSAKRRDHLGDRNILEYNANMADKGIWYECELQPYGLEQIWWQAFVNSVISNRIPM